MWSQGAVVRQRGWLKCPELTGRSEEAYFVRDEDLERQGGVLQPPAASAYFAVRQNGEIAKEALCPPKPKAFDKATFCG